MPKRIMWTSALALGLAALLTGPARAVAGPPEAEEAAVAALEAQERHCPDLERERSTAYAEALAATSAALARVSRALDASGAAHLLYWRGVLHACLGEEDRAVEDLRAFALGQGSDSKLGSLVKDARRRLRHLGAQLPVERKAPPAPAVAGGILLGAGGAAGGLAGWQRGVARTTEEAFVAGLRPWSETEALGGRATDADRRAGALGVAGVAAGIAGGVLVGLAAARGEATRASAFVLPLPDGGLALGIGGRW